MGTQAKQSTAECRHLSILLVKVFVLPASLAGALVSTVPAVAFTTTPLLDVVPASLAAVLDLVPVSLAAVLTLDLIPLVLLEVAAMSLGVVLIFGFVPVTFPLSPELIAFSSLSPMPVIAVVVFLLFLAPSAMSPPALISITFLIPVLSTIYVMLVSVLLELVLSVALALCVESKETIVSSEITTLNPAAPILVLGSGLVLPQVGKAVFVTAVLVLGTSVRLAMSSLAVPVLLNIAPDVLATKFTADRTTSPPDLN